MHTETIHYGVYINDILVAFQTVIVGVATWAFARFAPPAAKLFITDKMVVNAVNYAIGAVEGATKDKVLNLQIANTVIGVAEQFFLTRIPTFIKDETIPARKLIVAELTKLGVLPPDASGGKLQVEPREDGAH